MFNSIVRFVTGRYAAYQTPIILIYLLIHIPFLRCNVLVHVDLSSGVFDLFSCPCLFSEDTRLPGSQKETPNRLVYGD